MTDAIETLTFRPATEADIPFLLELRRRTMSEHLQASGIEPSESERRARVLASFDCAEIVLLAGAPVGLLKVERLGFRIVAQNDHAYDMEFGAK